AQGVEGLGRRDPDPAPLPGRESPCAAVGAELSALLVDDRPGFLLEPVASEELAVVAAAEEARLLALGPVRSREAGAPRLFPGLLLGLLAEREPDALEQLRLDPREHVRL